MLDNVEPKIDSQLTVKSDESLRLWLANQFARIKNEFFVRQRFLRNITGTFSTTSISGNFVLDTFVLSGNNFITASTLLLLELFGVTATTVAVKSVTVKADGVTIATVAGLGSANNTYKLELTICAITQNSQTSLAVALVNGASIVLTNYNTNIDFTRNVTFSVIANTTVSTATEITLKHLDVQYSGKLPNGGAA